MTDPHKYLNAEATSSYMEEEKEAAKKQQKAEQEQEADLPDEPNRLQSPIP